MAPALADEFLRCEAVFPLLDVTLRENDLPADTLVLQWREVLAELPFDASTGPAEPYRFQVSDFRVRPLAHHASPPPQETHEQKIARLAASALLRARCREIVGLAELAAWAAEERLVHSDLDE